MNEEKWLDVPGLEGCYQVSSFGRMRSLDRVGKTCYGKTRNLKGRIIGSGPGKHGYPKIPPGIYKTQLIHRIVAFAFIPNPSDLPFINHIDGNRANNRVENLEWCNQKHNVQHAFKIGLSKYTDLKKAEDSIAAKLTNDQVIEIKHRLRNGEKNVNIARDFPVSRSAIAEIKRGASWSSVKI